MRCETWFYSITVDEVDSPPEEIFEEEFEVHVRVEGAPSFLELDEDIDIALFVLFAPDEGPEDSDPTGAQAPDAFAVFLQRTEDVISRKHVVSYSCYPPIRITFFPRGLCRQAFTILSFSGKVTGMPGEKATREPSLTGPCCKNLQRMEAQDAAFESRLRALEGWRAEKVGEERGFDGQCRGRLDRGRQTSRAEGGRSRPRGVWSADLYQPGSIPLSP